MRSALTAALLAAALLLSGQAGARSHPHRAPVGTVAEPGTFDYYLLSMSWSPTYCLTHPENRAECGQKGYGLIVHGLWPQYERGGYPESCQGNGRGGQGLDAAALAAGRTLFPSESLLRHEWERHGSCTGLSAVDYLHVVDRASAVLKLPRELEAPAFEQQMSAGHLMELLRGANPTLPRAALRIACTADRLSEIRVCLTRELRPRDCGVGVSGHCPGSGLRIPSAR